MLQTYTPDQLAIAKSTGLVTSNGIYYLCKVGGKKLASISLLKEPHHTSKDVVRSKRELMQRRGLAEISTLMPYSAPRVRLSDTQKRLMKWLGHGWATDPSQGGGVVVNGQRMCAFATLEGLQRLGLIRRDENHCWLATEEGVQAARELGLLN